MPVKINRGIMNKDALVASLFRPMLMLELQMIDIKDHKKKVIAAYNCMLLFDGFCQWISSQWNIVCTVHVIIHIPKARFIQYVGNDIAKAASKAEIKSNNDVAHFIYFIFCYKISAKIEYIGGY